MECIIVQPPLILVMPITPIKITPKYKEIAERYYRAKQKICYFLA